MSLLELNLEKPAYKRVTEPATDETEAEVTEAPSTEAEADESGRRPTVGIAILLAAVIAALAIKRRRS